MQNYIYCHRINLISHTMKLWARIIEQNLRHETNVTENQFLFCAKKFNSGSYIHPEEGDYFERRKET